MSLKFLSFIIAALIFLIAGTIFFMSDQNTIVSETETDFSTIGTPMENAPVSFVDLLSTAPSPVQQDVLDTIHLDEYYLYPCTENGTVKNVLMLVAQYKTDITGNNSISEAEESITSFEESMYSEWGHIIYEESFNPDLNIIGFADEAVNDEAVWAEKYRVGTLSDNKTKIYYGWVLNYIVVASSNGCMLSTMKSVYEIH